MKTPDEARGCSSYEKRYSLGRRMADLSMPEPNSGCFLWLGALTDQGYGRIKHKCRFRRAHIVAWELANGKVPDGLVIDHRCRVRSCVNPDHMDVVTIGENIRRGVKARAKSGHPFPWTLKHGKRATYSCGLAGKP